MCNTVANVYVKSNYDWLRIDKALGSFRKSDNNKNKLVEEQRSWLSRSKNNATLAYGAITSRIKHAIKHAIKLKT